MATLKGPVRSAERIVRILEIAERGCEEEYVAREDRKGALEFIHKENFQDDGDQHLTNRPCRLFGSLGSQRAWTVCFSSIANSSAHLVGIVSAVPSMFQ
jgi:hypothetical protein